MPYLLQKRIQHGDGEGNDVLSAAAVLPSEKVQNAEAFQVHRCISLTLTLCTHVKYLHSEISPPTENSSLLYQM